MDPNLWLDEAGSSAMMDYTPDFLTRESNEELNTLPADSFATQQPFINIGGAESYQNDQMLHLEHGVPCFTDSSLSSRLNFQLPFMDDTTNYYSDNLGFLSHDYSSSLSNQQIDTPPARRSTTAQLPINFAGGVKAFTESYQTDHMLHYFEQDVMSFAADLRYTDAPWPSSVIPISSNPLMYTVQGATCSSLGRTRRETGYSSRRPYMKFSPEDVIQLILAVGQHGRRWKLIAQLPYFKDSGRTKEQLMEKWRHMTTGAQHKKDPDMRHLYIQAKNVNKLVDKKKMNGPGVLEGGSWTVDFDNQWLGLHLANERLGSTRARMKSKPLIVEINDSEPPYWGILQEPSSNELSREMGSQERSFKVLPTFRILYIL